MEEERGVFESPIAMEVILAFCRASTLGKNPTAADAKAI